MHTGFLHVLFCLSIASGAALASLNTAGVTPECTNSMGACGGCEWISINCLLSGCPEGMYCCQNGGDFSLLGDCCTTCNNQPVTTPVPASPVPCPPGTRVDSWHFPWSNPSDKCGDTKAMTACKLGLSLYTTKVLFDKPCDVAADWYTERCESMALALVEADAEFGPEAIVADLGVGLACVGRTYLMSFLCKHVVGEVITHVTLDYLIGKICEGGFWVFDKARSDLPHFRLVDLSIQPTGFPPSFEANYTLTTWMISGNKSTTDVTMAYDAENGKYYRSERFHGVNEGRMLTSKRVVGPPQAINSTNVSGCGVYWNGSSCGALWSDDQGIPVGGRARPLPMRFLNLILRVLATAEEDVHFVLRSNHTISPGTFRLTFAAKAANPDVLVMYTESSSGTSSLPEQLHIVDTTRNFTMHSLVFHSVTPNITESNWKEPSYCPFEVTKTCGFTCDNGWSWGTCPNSTYGISNESPHFGQCLRGLNLKTACPSQAPNCGFHSCMDAKHEFVCLQDGKPEFSCPSGHTCCSFSDRSCVRGPCTNSTPAAAVFPFAYDYSDQGLPPTTQGDLSRDGALEEEKIIGRAINNLVLDDVLMP